MLHPNASLNDMLIEGIKLNATDVHICVGAPPKARVYGSLEVMQMEDENGNIVDYPELTDQVAEGLIKPLLDLYARQTFTSEGQWDLAHVINIRKADGIRQIKFRVNIFKQKGAIAGVFRILPDKFLTAEELGLPQEFFRLTEKRRGMLLVTGATGSGKSTTLAAFVDIINRTMPKHIITLEDPIEYEHWHSKSNICQREIGTDVNTFDNGLRAALREDPDVILVGEMRDRETIEIALRSAETGHLLLSTLHTIGAVETVDRIVNSFPEARHMQVREQLASVIEAVISQQLLPKKEGKGYVVAYEILYKTREVQRLIRNNEISKLEDYLRSEDAHNLGMITMDESIINLYNADKITAETAVSYSVDKRAMERLLNI